LIAVGEAPRWRNSESHCCGLSHSANDLVSLGF
jgi:hypothetical protein